MTRKKEDLRAEIEKKADVRYFTMSDGVKVRVLEFNFAENPRKHKLMLIPGFVTIFQSWKEIIEILSKEYHIYYFESREKSSSIMPKRKMERQVTLQKMAHDIKEVVEQLNLDKQKYITLCSSTGGTIEVEALSEKWLHPNGAVMVGPTVEYDVRFFAAFGCTVVPEFVKKFFLPFFRLYMGKIYVDKKKYPEQYAKYVRAGEESNLRKIRKVLWQMTKYECWDMVPKIEAKCLLIGATEDKMHASEMTYKVHQLIPNSEYIDLGTNKNAHSQPLADTINKFVDELD
ncbi:MAG: alpha/beta fold hydrolase [Candidatus Thorarchaeota archaeon]